MTADELVAALKSGAVIINSLTINNYTAETIITGAVSVTNNPQPKALAAPDPWAWRTEDLDRRAAQWQRDYAAECDQIWEQRR